MQASTSPKATLYVASSLNGFMTNGDMDSSWVSPHDEKMFAQVCAEVGCILVGRKTFDQYQGVVYPVPSAINVVMTSTPQTHPDPNVLFVRTLDEALATIAQNGFKRFVVVGGAQTIGACFNRHLIDRLYLSLHPYIFTQGLPFTGPLDHSVNARFEGVKFSHPEFLLLDYSLIAPKDNIK
jgi:dihydrofolate reductase